MKLAFILGVMAITASFSYGQTEKTKTADKIPQKKEQHIKIVMNQNGKEVKIDTTFTSMDEKVVQVKVDSIMNKLDKSGNSKVIILRGGGASAHSSHSGNLPGENQMNVFYTTTDSGKVRNVRKVIRMEDAGPMVVTENFDGDMMPPPPPPPPPPFHMRGYRVAADDPFAMDPGNKDIISYEKKDLGKGLEKITIVRKKRSTPSEEKNVEVKVEVLDDSKK